MSKSCSLFHGEDPLALHIEDIKQEFRVLIQTATQETQSNSDYMTRKIEIHNTEADEGLNSLKGLFKAVEKGQAENMDEIEQLKLVIQKLECSNDGEAKLHRLQEKITNLKKNHAEKIELARQGNEELTKENQRLTEELYQSKKQATKCARSIQHLVHKARKSEEIEQRCLALESQQRSITEQAVKMWFLLQTRQNVPFPNRFDSDGLTMPVGERSLQQELGWCIPEEGTTVLGQQIHPSYPPVLAPEIPWGLIRSQNSRSISNALARPIPRMNICTDPDSSVMSESIHFQTHPLMQRINRLERCPVLKLEIYIPYYSRLCTLCTNVVMVWKKTKFGVKFSAQRVAIATAAIIVSVLVVLISRWCMIGAQLDVSFPFSVGEGYIVDGLLPGVHGSNY